VVCLRYGSGATVSGGVESTGSDGVSAVFSDLGDSTFFYDGGVDHNPDTLFLVRAGEDQLLGPGLCSFADEARAVESGEEFDSEDLTVHLDLGVVRHVHSPLDGVNITC